MLFNFSQFSPAFSKMDVTAFPLNSAVITSSSKFVELFAETAYVSLERSVYAKTVALF